MRFHQRLFAVVAATALGASTAAFAQSDPGAYPSHVVKIVHQYTAGGGNDYLARIAANGLAERWGQSVIVEPRPGGGGIIGADAVAKATPDGCRAKRGVSKDGPHTQAVPHRPPSCFETRSLRERSSG